MKEINFVVWKEDKYYISRCLNAEVSSFGEIIDEAVKNLKEAVGLYFEGESKELPEIKSIFIGKEFINA
jgi:predicted RNase H-like HicB family nuclease